MTLPDFLEPTIPEREQAAYQPGQHGARAEADRLACLHHLFGAQECLATLSNVIRGLPDDDWVADEVIRRFSTEIARASQHLGSFRDLRDCAGQA